MRIKEIELDNFKSFGRHTVIPMLPGFTTISGPNGSGKSNIVDSLLFALGLSSTRSMRAERLPDLLNNLSGKNEAKVIVRFTNNEGLELEVCRRVRVKENSYTSVYTLNGKAATLTEIHDELTKYNVSPTGFNVIMQGDVTGIVTMSGSERRKIIDELAGVAEFDRRIEQAGRELEVVGEKIEHQKIILAEIVNRLEVLRSDRDQALKYLDLKNQKDSLEKDLIFVKAQELELEVQAELQELEELDDKEKSLDAKIRQCEVTLVALKAEMVSVDEEIREKGGNEQLLIRQELDNKRGELTRAESKLSNLAGAIDEKTRNLKKLEGQLKAIDKNLSELCKRKKLHRLDIEKVNLALAEKQGAMSAVVAEIEVARQEKDRSSDKVTGIHAELQNLRDKRHQWDVKKTEFKAKKQGLEKELEQLREFATQSISQSASHKNLIQALVRKHQDQEALTCGIERTIEQLNAELVSTNEEIEAKQEALSTVNKRIIELETTREVQGESGYGRAVEAVLSSGIKGVYGTIGQLGNVEDKYVIALETAIGNRLSHIVVDDDQVAQNCIAHLKETSAGRCTFIPLNKVVAQPPGLLPGHPGVIDFAYNLIAFDLKFAKAFQYACGQTVVVDTMNTARKLINQARLVTLEGELFEKSGTISGGNDGKNKMHFSAKGKTDLQVLKHTAANLTNHIRSLKDAVKELTQSLNEERDKANAGRLELARMASELESKRKENNELDEQIDNAKPKLRNSGDEIDRIDHELSEIDATISNLTKDIDGLQNKLDQLKDRGNQTTIEKLIHESEGLREELDNIERQSNDIQREIDMVETEERVETGNREDLAQQVGSALSEIEEVKAQKPEHEAIIAQLKEVIAEMEQKVSALSEELEDLRKTKENIHEKVTEEEIDRTKTEQARLYLEEQRNERKAAHLVLKEELSAVKQEIERVKEANPQYEPPSQGTVEQIKREVDRLEKRMRALEPVNMKALEEYNQTDERQKELNTYLDTLALEKEEINQRIAGYDELKKRTFMEAFHAINNNFQEIFAELSHGHGRLELENPENPFAGGLIIRAQPRDKKMQRIEALSGGEKSLTALSFVFAFQRFAPAPFYAFDEVDMMLDGSNAERLARMVRHQSLSAQFVVVSLRRPMIENSDHAIGVSLRADGYSKVVGLSEINLPHDGALVHASA